MKKFKVILQDTRSYHVIVEAKNQDEAWAIGENTESTDFVENTIDRSWDVIDVEEVKDK